MKRNAEIVEFEIDYNVLNALNLANEALGKHYELTGNQPFGQGFELDADFVKTLLYNSKNFELDSCPTFLDYGGQTVAQNFTNALNATNSMIENLMQIKSKEYKKQIQNMLNLLRLRSASLLYASQQVLLPNSNSIFLYNSVRKISPLLDDILKESYEKELEEKLAKDRIMFFIVNSVPKQSVEQKLSNAKQTKQNKTELEQKKVEEKPKKVENILNVKLDKNIEKAVAINSTKTLNRTKSKNAIKETNKEDNEELTF